MTVDRKPPLWEWRAQLGQVTRLTRRGVVVSTVTAAALALLIVATGSLMVWRADDQQIREGVLNSAIARAHSLRQNLDLTRCLLADLTEQLRSADDQATIWTRENASQLARHLPWIQRIAWVESEHVPESAGHLLRRARDAWSNPNAGRRTSLSAVHRTRRSSVPHRRTRRLLACRDQPRSALAERQPGRIPRRDSGAIDRQDESHRSGRASRVGPRKNAGDTDRCRGSPFVP